MDNSVFRILGLLLALLLSANAAAHQTASAASALGYSWLADQQLASGAIQTEQGSVGAQAATHEAALALINAEKTGLIDTVRLAAYQAGLREPSTESLAKRVLLGLKLGLTVDVLEEKLLLAQNADGGFGDQPGYDSTVYDTTFALQALVVTDKKASAVTARAVAYLLEQQRADGSFALAAYNQSSIYLTSLVARALRPLLYTYQVSAALTAARDYLLSYAGAKTGWQSDWQAAVFLLAVIPLTTDPSGYQPVVEWLRMQQLPNGSWQNDVFATGLALQALYLSDNIVLPAEPDKAVIKGQLVDHSSGQAVAGVTIGVSPAIGVPIVTDSKGEFVITGLKPGGYRLTYAVAGYLTATQQLQVEAGQLIDLGRIALTAAPTTAVLFGVVVDGKAGTPLAGAQIKLTAGGSSQTAVTATDGSYRLQVPAGQASIEVSAVGYNTVAASASLPAGQTLNFSPSLYALSQLPDPLLLEGKVVSAADGQPLSGVMVTPASGGSNVMTDAQGHFELQGLGGGQTNIELSLAGYQSVAMSLLLPESGKLDAGVIRLASLEKLQTSSLMGSVLDADTGAGVAGAQVRLDNLSAITDAAGHYQLNQITSLDFVVGASAAGYMFSSRSINLTQPQTLNFDLKLRRADMGGIVVDAVHTDKPSYRAYQPLHFEAVLTNKTARERQVRLYVLIRDNQGKVLDRFPGANLPLLSDNSNPEAIAHYKAHLAASIQALAPNETRVIALKQGWNSGIQPPGDYQVTIQALDATTSKLISEKSAVFHVEPTHHLTSVVAEASPAFALLHSTAAIQLLATLHNDSNLPTQMTLGYRLLSPTGELLTQGSKPVELLPEDVTKQVELANWAHQFTQSGNYSLELSILQGPATDALVSGKLFVPPTIHLRVQQQVTPEQVLPGDERTVDVGIRVEGVEDK